MNPNKKIWKYATALVVMLIIANPELFELALFIDTVGLEIYLMLIEIQVIVLSTLYYNASIKPVLIRLRLFYAKHIRIFRQTFSWQQIKLQPENLLLALPSPAAIMQILVLTTALGIVF